MQWSEVRKIHPEQWVVIEALEAHTEANKRLFDDIAVVKVCRDGAGAMQAYRRLHRQYPRREFYFIHTNHKALEIQERRWLGIRADHAIGVEI